MTKKLTARLRLRAIGRWSTAAILVALTPTTALAADSQIFNFEPVITTIVVFLAVLYVLRSKAWGPLIQALDDRERKIRESLEAAERATAESERVAKEHERILSEARKEATAIVEEGKRDAEAVRSRIVSEAQSESETIKDRAIADIQRAKDNAVHDIHMRAVDLSIQISEKLVQKSLSAEEHKGLIDEAIQSYETLS